MKRKNILPLCSLITAVGLFLAACQPIPSQTDISDPDPSMQNTFLAETRGADVTMQQEEPVYRYDNVAYGEHDLQVMDIYIPEGSQDARYPVVLTLHGGEWMSGDKTTLKQYTTTVLAANCIHVNMNYRLIDDGIPPEAEIPYEEMLNDIEAALDFLVLNAEQYQIDTTRAAIAGYSSGGHLALLYAYTRTDASIPIKLVISEAGPANFMDPKTFAEDGDIWLHESHNGHGDIEVTPSMTKEHRLYLFGAVTGTEYGEPGWEQAWEKASPALIVTDSSPKTFLFYGSHDAVTPMSHAQLLESNHPDCTLYEIFNATHNLHTNFTEIRNYQIRLRAILEEL